MTLVHQRPHVALCCELESALEVGLSFILITFRQRPIARELQRMGPLFAKHAAHLNMLAAEVERAMTEPN